ncbi:MAG: hypothetical protein AB2809_09585 [Candidatus Thiodiazotropha sp.]
MSDPQIFSVVQVPILGQLGEDTEIIESRTCSTCNAAPLQEIDYLHYLFDYWEGQLLVGVAQSFIVAEDLRNALMESDMTGFTLREMYVEYSEDYIEQPGDPDLVDFWHLSIENRIPAGSGWWTRDGVCPDCGRTRWRMNEFTTRGITRGHLDPKVPPRTVVRSGYKGWDIFYLDDPGTAVISERMRDFLLAHGVVGLEVQQAVFVETPEGL